MYNTKVINLWYNQVFTLESNQIMTVCTSFKYILPLYQTKQRQPINLQRNSTNNFCDGHIYNVFPGHNCHTCILNKTKENVQINRCKKCKNDIQQFKKKI